jgi:hypothetical protein
VSVFERSESHRPFQRSQAQQRQGQVSQVRHSHDHTQGHQLCLKSQNQDKPDQDWQTARIGVKKKARGMRITKTRTNGTTKVKTSAKQARINTMGATPTRIKANEDQRGNSLVCASLHLRLKWVDIFLSPRFCYDQRRKNWTTHTTTLKTRLSSRHVTSGKLEAKVLPLNAGVARQAAQPRDRRGQNPDQPDPGNYQAED